MVRRFAAATRRNHGLEHGTVTLLLADRGPARIIARAGHDGFYIWGALPTDVLETTARRALRRMRDGEAMLAVSPLCGTNIATAGVLAGAGALLAAGRSRAADRIPAAITAAMLGVVASQPVGRWLQRYVTTSPDMAGMEITGVRAMGERLHKVETRWVPRAARKLVAVNG